MGPSTLAHMAVSATDAFLDQPVGFEHAGQTAVRVHAGNSSLYQPGFVRKGLLHHSRNAPLREVRAASQGFHVQAQIMDAAHHAVVTEAFPAGDDRLSRFFGVVSPSGARRRRLPEWKTRRLRGPESGPEGTRAPGREVLRTERSSYVLWNSRGGLLGTAE